MPLLPVDAVRRRAQQARSVAAGASRAALVASSHRAFPVESGTLPVRGLNGLDAPIEVIRDRSGIPHIFASSERDAFFGQGFVHAQDRLFQMDSLRRAGQGRISEWAGPPAVEADRFLRRLGFADIAGRDLAAASEEDRALLIAFAEGVNAGIVSLTALPPEYAFLGDTPEPWHPEHTMLLGRFILFSFATNWDTELVRERLLRAVGAEQAAHLEPLAPVASHTVTGSAPASVVERVIEAYKTALDLGIPEGSGSNAWVVNAERTRTGAPLLASDPHLESRMPGLLHVSHVVGGGYDVIGANVPGVPLVAMGHNRDLAWGITAGLADVGDCYIETVDPADPTRYLTLDGWRTGRTRIERIEVRGADPVEERVLETRHGPVIGPLIPGETRAIALRSTGLEPGDPLGPVLALCRATTVEEFDAAVAARPGVTFNYVYAHRGGRIGYRMSGSVPRRAHGEGLLPQQGAGAAEPSSYLPPEEMPHAHDPASGMVVSANQSPGFPGEFGEDFCEGERAERIAALLEGYGHHDIGSFAAIQRDTRSELLLRLRTLLEASGALEDPEVRAIVSAWDGQVTAESAAAALLETVLREAAQALATRVAGSEARVLLGAGVGSSLGGSSFAYRAQGWVVRALEGAALPWCDGAADRDRTLRAATNRAIEHLHGRLGKRASAWRWGDIHLWKLPHALDAVPGLGKWFSRGPYPAPGDVNTVWQGATPLSKSTETVSIMPGYRQVLDLSDWDRSIFMLSTGSSGIPGHPRYGDCIPEFLGGRYRPLLYTREAVQAAAEHTLLLEPV